MTSWRGKEVITLAEHYGMPADEPVADTDWIEEAAQCEWPILMKDKRIRHRQAEITAVSPLGRWALTTRAATDTTVAVRNLTAWCALPWRPGAT
jgi:PIN like domain